MKYQEALESRFDMSSRKRIKRDPKKIMVTLKKNYPNIKFELKDNVLYGNKNQLGSYHYGSGNESIQAIIAKMKMLGLIKK